MSTYSVRTERMGHLQIGTYDAHTSAMKWLKRQKVINTSLGRNVEDPGVKNFCMKSKNKNTLEHSESKLP